MLRAIVSTSRSLKFASKRRIDCASARAASEIFGAFGVAGAGEEDGPAEGGAAPASAVDAAAAKNALRVVTIWQASEKAAGIFS